VPQLALDDFKLLALLFLASTLLLLLIKPGDASAQDVSASLH